MSRSSQVLAILGLPVFCFSGTANGDLYRWDTGASILEGAVGPGSAFDDRDVSYGDFRGADLSRATFWYAHLTNADFSGATIQGATFNDSNFSLAQLTSTASYLRRDLQGVGLQRINLRGANL